jgi:hypothetical protein
MSAGTRPSDNREYFGLFIGMFCPVRRQDPVMPTKAYTFACVGFLLDNVPDVTGGWRR